MLIACSNGEKLKESDESFSLRWNNSTVKVNTEKYKRPNVRPDIFLGSLGEQEALGFVGQG